MAGLAYLKNVNTLELFEDKCVGCNVCIDVCPHEVFAANGKVVNIIDLDACMECGACALNCPTQALTVVAGVGCAAAIIGDTFGRTSNACACTVEAKVVGNSSDEETPACC